MMHMFLYILYILLVSLEYVSASISVQSPVKIIESPTHISYPLHARNNINDDHNNLKLLISPLKVTGPPHLKHLLGSCLETSSLNYKYRVCPYDNCTQHEQSIRWNPYNGVLGVYQGWLIVNNTFQAMLFQKGDECGGKHRSLKLEFECNSSNHSNILSSVRETQTCMYSVTMVTPLVCHSQSMLVYPTLSVAARDIWDATYTRYVNHELTEKGYQAALQSIMRDERIVFGGKPRHSPSAVLTKRATGGDIGGDIGAESQVEKVAVEGPWSNPAAEKEENKFKMNFVENFTSLNRCQEEYQTLKSVIGILQKLLKNKQSKT